MVQAVAPAVVHAAPPGEAVAVYPVTVPPVMAGAAQDTAAVVSPGRAVRLAGGDGATRTGAPRWLVVASPSCPDPFVPQQEALPASSIAQVYRYPAVIWATGSPGQHPMIIDWLGRGDEEIRGTVTDLA
jgi:hypothetical protein